VSIIYAIYDDVKHISGYSLMGYSYGVDVVYSGWLEKYASLGGVI